MLTPFEPLTPRVANHDSPAARNLTAVRVLLGLSFGTAILISWPMWLSAREFPLVPIFSFLPPLPNHLDLVPPALLLLSLAVTLFIPSRAAAVSVITITLALWAQDQNRIHPWSFVFLLFYAVMAKRWNSKSSAQTRDDLTSTLYFILVAVYFWTGFQKLRISYFQGISPLLSSTVGSDTTSQLIQALLWSVPGLEIASACLLVTRPFRRLGILIAIFLHCTIIGMLLVGGVNYSVIPWNVFMAGAVISLFWRSNLSPREILTPGSSLFAGALRLLSGILPALGYLGWWNSYLSFAVYAGAGGGGYAFIDDPREALSKTIPFYPLSPDNSRVKEVPLDAWGYSVLRSMPSPEPRVIKAVGSALCRDYLPSGGQMIIYFTEPMLPWETKKHDQEYRCENGALVPNSSSPEGVQP